MVQSEGLKLSCIQLIFQPVRSGRIYDCKNWYSRSDSNGHQSITVSDLGNHTDTGTYFYLK